MPNNMKPGPPNPSHDDLSNPGPHRPDSAVVDNDAHDRNDDGPGAPESEPDSDPGDDDPTSAHAREEKAPKRILSDMAPPGQDEVRGSE